MSDKCPPISPKDAQARYKNGLDFILVSGDAYVDHPSFGVAIIARTLMAEGYAVAVLAQPDWHGPGAFRAFGKPKLAFLVTSGNIDSMVNHYTASKRRRGEDAYSEGGVAGKRPDRAAIVYSNLCKQAYSDVPVVLGGVEASLRRFAHYDYWDDRVRHSILYDAGADLLVYGMGERAILQIADALRRGARAKDIRVSGTCFQTNDLSDIKNYLLLPSYTEVAKDRKKYAAAFLAQMREQDAIAGKTLVQPHEKGYLVALPPQKPLSETEMDATYALPYTRRAHPEYTETIPALAEVEFSLTSARGCFGGCSFCALTFHQGRVVSARSHASLIREAKILTASKNFKGYIHDVGGPTANFRESACEKQLKKGVCRGQQCIGHKPCKNLRVSHADYLSLLRKLRALPKVKKVFVRSGIRYDYVLLDQDDSFLRELVRHHISGQLKIAPEHIAERTLFYMNKPPAASYERFLQKYQALCKQEGKDQYVVPYLMSSHPGCTLQDAVELAIYLKKHKHRPQQVQDFYPTPGTLSTCMYHTGIDPRSGDPVHIPKTEKEKRMQRALMQYYLPQNYAFCRDALRECGREDLIGYGGNCLVPPERKKQ
ncbi:MAG: YgiQ family radical SAM protein [Clostridiales bacterium]|nr:YgiQ family radical SAM protein [Clostridiales bacterium]